MAVSGSDFGIVAIQNGTGNVQINVAGDIEGGNGGIVTTSTQGSTINVAAGGRVGSTTGPAIQTGDTGNGAADIVTVSGIVNGAINTLGGNDTVAVTAGSAVNGAIMTVLPGSLMVYGKRCRLFSVLALTVLWVWRQGWWQAPEPSRLRVAASARPATLTSASAALPGSYIVNASLPAIKADFSGKGHDRPTFRRAARGLDRQDAGC